MKENFLIVIYVSVSIAMLFLAPYVVYYAGPFIPFAHLLGKAIAAVLAIISFPIGAHAIATNQLDNGTKKIMVYSAFAWLLLALTTPLVDVEERWTVCGTIEAGGMVYEMTELQYYHCREDAVLFARKVFESKDEWEMTFTGDDDSGGTNAKLTKDVRIDFSSKMPSCDWINRVTGSYYGHAFYSTTLQRIDEEKFPGIPGKLRAPKTTRFQRKGNVPF